MKLIRFTTADSPNPCFGVVVRDQAVPFAVLQSKAGKSSPYLADSRSYLANLPDSERAAKELLAWGEQHLDELGAGRTLPSQCRSPAGAGGGCRPVRLRPDAAASQELRRNDREV